MDVCKKLELNPLRFDRDIRVLSKKKIFSKKISFVRPANEKRRKSAGFRDFSEIFFLHGQLLPPYSICGLTMILESVKKQKNGKIPGKYQDPKTRVTKG